MVVTLVMKKLKCFQLYVSNGISVVILGDGELQKYGTVNDNFPLPALLALFYMNRPLRLSGS